MLGHAGPPWSPSVAAVAVAPASAAATPPLTVNAPGTKLCRSSCRSFPPLAAPSLRSGNLCRCRTAPHCRCGCCSRPGHCRRLSRAWPDRGIRRELGACFPRLLCHRASTNLCYSWRGLFGSCSHGWCSGGPSGGGCFRLGGLSGRLICLSEPQGAEAGVHFASCL